MVDKEKTKTRQGKDRDKTRKFLSLLHDKVLVRDVVGCGVVWYGMDGFCLSLHSFFCRLLSVFLVSRFVLSSLALSLSLALSWFVSVLFFYGSSCRDALTFCFYGCAYSVTGFYQIGQI